jgi:tRNA threonylcarbamoyladenosine biosynthesis protein TsaB
MLLAIDTATRYASIALYDAAGIAAESSWRSENNHSVEVMPAIAAMLSLQRLEPRDLTAVAVAQGPGSFTGLRIGMSIAKGFCLALDIPIIAVPSLDVVTYAAGDPGGPILAVLETGRGRLAVARYRFDEGLPAQDSDISVVLSSRWAPETDGPMLITGEVSAELAERLLALPNADDLSISCLAASLRRAGYLAELAWERLQEDAVDDLDTVSPIYAHYPAPGAAEGLDACVTP